MGTCRVVVTLASVTVLLGASWTEPARAQEKVVKVNLAADVFLDALPYWESFVLQGGIPAATDRVRVFYWPEDAPPAEAQMAEWTAALAGYEAEKQFSVPREPLQPNQPYVFCVGVYGNPATPVTDPPEAEGGVIRSTQTTCADILASSSRAPSAPAHIHALPGTVARSTWQQHFDTDAGVMLSDVADYVGIVTGVHLYLVPIRKDVDLLSRDVPPLRRFGRRFSLYVGVSPIEIHSDTDRPVLKTSVGIPVVGIGARGPLYWFESGGPLDRFLPLMRVNAGMMFFEQDDANPIIDVEHRKRDFFASLSLDLEVSSVLAPLVGVLGLK